MRIRHKDLGQCNVTCNRPTNNACLQQLARPAGLFLSVVLAACLSLPVQACLSVNITGFDLDFGSYDPLDYQDLESNLAITVDCLADGITPTIPLPYQVGLENLGGGGAAQRILESPEYQLTYQIYTDPSRSTEWGALGTTSVVSGVFLASLVDQSHSLTGLGVIPGRQNIGAGSYTDSLAVTVEF